MCPPVEYDPRTAEPLTELVEVGTAGEVTTLGLGQRAPDGQPLDHAVRLGPRPPRRRRHRDAARRRRRPGDAMSTGMRVRIRWADEREGAITDIACFEPETASMSDVTVSPFPDGLWSQPAVATSGIAAIDAWSRSSDPHAGPRSTTRTPPAAARPATCAASPRGKLLGERCPECRQGVRPAPGRLPRSTACHHRAGRRAAERGTVVSFCVVNIEFTGRGIEIPYASRPGACPTAPTWRSSA